VNLFKGIWKDPKSTVIGLAVIGLTVALAMGRCTFSDWKEFVIIAIGLLAGAGAMLANTKKEP
jgi:hypothetical protein